MYTVSKDFEVACAHRIVGHKGLCANLHGHNYTIRLFFSSEELNEMGMVIDFGDIQPVIDSLKKAIDHKLLIWCADSTMYEVYERLENMPDGIYDINSIFRTDFNITAENMCKWIFDSVFVKHHTLSKVQIWETSKCYAEYYKESAHNV